MTSKTKIITIEIADRQDLPGDATRGAHVSGPGWSGYYMLGERADALERCGYTVILVHRPDFDDVDVDAAIDEELGL